MKEEPSDAMEIDNSGSESEGSINDYETDNLDNCDLEPNVKLRKKKKLPLKRFKYVCRNRFHTTIKQPICRKVKKKNINLTKLLTELTLKNNIDKST